MEVEAIDVFIADVQLYFFAAAVAAPLGTDDFAGHVGFPLDGGGGSLAEGELGDVLWPEDDEAAHEDEDE